MHFVYTVYAVCCVHVVRVRVERICSFNSSAARPEVSHVAVSVQRAYVWESLADEIASNPRILLLLH